MPRWIRRSATSVPACAAAGALLIVSCLGLGGCAGPFRLGPLHFKLASLPPPPLKAPAYSLDATPSPIGLPELLDPGFYPPGATKIAPDRGDSVTLVPAARAAYPSDVRSVAPTGGTVLFTESRAIGSGGLVHQLVVATKRIRRTPYQTAKQFWTLWSPNGKQIAVTVFTGSNASFVFVIDVATGSCSPPLSPLAPFTPPFTDDERYAPQWVVAYAWTPKGKLIVRGTGMSGSQPTAFGYEVLADVSSPRAPAFRLLRAYRLETPRRARISVTPGRHP